jgi:hypothetical protein
VLLAAPTVSVPVMHHAELVDDDQPDGAQLRRTRRVCHPCWHSGDQEGTVPLSRDAMIRLGLCCMLWAACSGPPGPPVLVAPREVESSSRSPRITRVQDLGAPSRLVAGEAVQSRGSDGVAVVGEVLLVTGKGFGRQPRVRVAAQYARELGRTEDGGILVRVPWGVRVGPQTVEVVNPHGRSQQPFMVRRYGLASVPSRDSLHVLEVTRQSASVVGKPIALPGARLIRYSTDGQIAYVSGREESGEGRSEAPKGGRLTVSTIDMTAPGGPRLLDTRALPGERLLALTAAEDAPVAAAISDTHIVFFDTRDPRSPAPYRPRPLPEELREGVITAEMDHQGRLLAVLLSTSNKVSLFEVVSPEQLRLLATTQVLPKASTSLVRDMRFSSDSSTLWVISGDNAESVEKGHSPLRLSVIRIQMSAPKAKSKSFGVLSLWRGLDVPYKAAPVSLAVAKGQPTADGATVRVPPHNAAVFITAHQASLLKLAHTRFDQARGLRRAVEILLKETERLGTMVRTDLSGKGGVMFDSPSLLGSVDITSDTQLLLVACAKVEVRKNPASVRLIYGITTARVFGATSPTFLPLGEVDPESLARPFLLGDVRVQP